MRLPDEDAKYNILMIAPRDIRREVLKDYTVKRFPNYLSLKKHLLEMVLRDAEDGKRPALGALEHEGAGEGEAAITEEEAKAKIEQLNLEINALKGRSPKGGGKKGAGGKLKGGGKNNGNCAICNSPDHWKNECPENKFPPSKGAPKGGGKGTQKGFPVLFPGKGGAGAKGFFQQRQQGGPPNL